MIFIVGAGPGDSGLLTLRGCDVLKRADAVIFDHLVGEGVLAMIPESAEKFDAGKFSGSHTMTQAEIESLMISLARSGKNVVRLKGGDPYVFGRGGEEAEAVIKAGLPFEIVPGVTSAVSVPAYAGIPVTHRDYCSGLRIFTARDKDGKIPDFSGATSVFLMGVSNSEALQEKLLAEMPGETPCAVIQDGTLASQRTVRTTVGELHSSVTKNKISAPAIIVAGRTAALNLKFNLSLSGKRIIITRPEKRSEKLSRILKDKGAEVILLPTIKTRTIHGALDGVELGGFGWIGFTSVTGVEAFFELLCETGRDIREIGSAKIAAIGQATKDALTARGLRVDYVPEIFDGENLALGLVEKAGINEKILMFRAENGTPEISGIFGKYGIKNFQICIYRIDYVKLTHVPKFADMIVFTSSSTVRGLAENTDSLRDSLAVCIGRQTADEARREGFERIRIANQASVEAIAEACEQ